MGHLVVAGKAGRILPILPIADQLASGANIARGRARYFGNAITSRGIRDAASGFYGDSSPFLPHPTPPHPARRNVRVRGIFIISESRGARNPNGTYDFDATGRFRPDRFLREIFPRSRLTRSDLHDFSESSKYSLSLSSSYLG